MSICQPAAQGETGWADRYERLRQHALGGAAPDGGLSELGVLLQNGVAVWMQATLNEAMTEENSLTSSCGWLITDPEETTLVLAEITLSQFVQPHRRN